MILYHITQDLSHDGYFYPNIPSAILLNENQSSNRVCASRTLEGCLGSIPGGGENLEETMAEKGDIFKIFRIDTNKLGINLTLNDQELLDRLYVFDSLESGEHWILEPFLVPDEDISYIRLEGYDGENEGYKNCHYYESRDRLGLTDEAFMDSDEFDPEEHINYFMKFYSLEYRVIEEGMMEEELEKMKEEYGIG